MVEDVLFSLFDFVLVNWMETTQVGYYRNKADSRHEEKIANNDQIPKYLEALLTPQDLHCDSVTPILFLSNLRLRGLRHPTARHPFFVGMANGTLPNVPMSLLDFSIQKLRLCEHFHAHTCDQMKDGCATIVSTSEDREADPLSRLVHLDQMRSAPAGTAHHDMLKRFKEELEREVDESSVEFVTHKLPRLKNLGPRLSEVCKLGNVPFVVGALCCKVNPVIGEIYKLIIEAIEKYTHLPPRAYFFFRYSIEVESVLLGVLERLAEEYLVSPQARIDAAKGYWASLNVVYRYFAELYERSIHFPPKRKPSSMQYLKTRVYRPLSHEIVYEADELTEHSISESDCEVTFAPTTNTSTDKTLQVLSCNESDDASLPRNVLNVEWEYQKVSPLMKRFYREESPLEEDLSRLSLNM
jgi:hypothetical protein